MPFAKLHRTDDTRDSISKANRRELIEFAHHHGHTDINETMSASDYTLADGRVIPGIRTLLRQRGLNHIPIPERRLGAIGRHETHPLFTKPQQAPKDKEWEEFQRWKASQKQPPEKPKRLAERPKSRINALRDECKRLGIPMVRKDNIETLTAKIKAHE